MSGGNGAGTAADQLDNPLGVAVDAGGDLYIADTDNQRVQETYALGPPATVAVASGTTRAPPPPPPSPRRWWSR